MRPIDRLLDIMAQLRDPVGGCPWDVEQTFATIAPYTIEEAYEVADAIERGDIAELRDELGDLLLQVVFHAQMAREAGEFDFDAVAAAISEKMVRRHPHVFGDAAVADAEAQTRAWEEHKEKERESAGKAAQEGVLGDVPLALPALLRAEKLGKRAARAGFDWDQPEAVARKVDEELDEVRETFDIAGDQAEREHEIGDLLFACAQLARHLGVNPETALRAANGRFEARFRFMEERLAEGSRNPSDADSEELEELWNRAKAQEKAAKQSQSNPLTGENKRGKHG